MDKVYDVVFLGTGLTECVLSGMCCTMEKQEVLQMDRNSYYGGEATSMILDDLYKKFGMSEQPPAEFGRCRDWNVDLVPKFLMADGKLVKLLVSTGVTSYMEFKSADGSYVYKGGKIFKVPSNSKEGLATSLMGMFEKRRFIKFIHFAYDYDKEDPKTHNSTNPAMKMNQVFDKFGLDDNTKAFIGHAMALYRNDKYLEENCVATIMKVKLYLYSIARYGNSPYLYPMYGLGELPQGFARRCAVFGGTYMLNKPIEKVEKMCDGLIGITSGGETVKARKVVGDPSYFPDRVRKVGQVIRAICVLSHTIPNTNDAKSCQIIIPQVQVKRQHDIYVLSVSDVHKVCPKGKFIAIVSTVVETNRPENEIQPALDLLGFIEKKFVSISDQFEPMDDGRADNIFVSRSYDATTHFETTCDDIIDLYRRMFDKDIDFNAMKADFNIPEE